MCTALSYRDVRVGSEQKLRSHSAADIKVHGWPHLKTANEAERSELFGGIGWYEEGYRNPSDPKSGPHLHVDLRDGQARWGFDKSGRAYHGYFPKYKGEPKKQCP